MKTGVGGLAQSLAFATLLPLLAASAGPPSIMEGHAPFTCDLAFQWTF
ncbi:MAG TPA: hypothetical protein VGG92_10785 [Caulobacteraceae bacterium]|jgi:hypothetical protein